MSSTISGPGPGAGSLIHVEGLRIAYSTSSGEHEAVRGVSFDVQPGEIVAIVGESGSGKTTVANALVGMLPYNAKILGGTLSIVGEEVSGKSERSWQKLRGDLVGLVPQDPSVSLNPLMRVGDQVAESLRLHRNMPKKLARKRAVELLNDAGIKNPEARALQYPHELSGGMRQRVLIAGAIACEPKLIVADEPTSALDVTVQQQILDHLDFLVVEHRMGMILITHDLAVAADRAQRIIVMNKGEIVESGTAEQVMKNPQADYTKRLLDAAPSMHLTTMSAGQRPLKIDEDAKVALELQELTKRFALPGAAGYVTAVNSVSLRVRQGETLGIVGESGSGKSTLARVLLDLDKPTSGRVLVDGVDTSTLKREELRQLRRRMQVVFQNPYSSLDPRFTLAQIVEEPMRSFRIGTRAERTARVKELFDLVALPASAMGRKAAELSGGQRQRIAIARALSVRPSILVCDEPTSALDVSVQAQILDLLAELKRELGVTMLFISHDLAVVRQVSDSVAVMSFGDLVEHGPADQVFDNPQHEYTQELLAAIPGHAGFHLAASQLVGGES